MPITTRPLRGFFHTRTEQMDARLSNESPVPSPNIRTGWAAGPKQRVALLATDAIAETIRCGFVIEEIGAKDRIMKPAHFQSFPRPHHAANGVFPSRRAGPFETNASLERPSLAHIRKRNAAIVGTLIILLETC